MRHSLANIQAQILVQLYENNTYLGGGYAVIKLGWLHIDLLWVEKNYRGHGYGKQILSKLEQYALERHNINFQNFIQATFRAQWSFTSISVMRSLKKNLKFTQKMPGKWPSHT